MDRDFSVRIYDAIHPETEDIFHGLKGRFDGKFSEERLFLFQGLLETEVRDLLSSGVNLAVVIAIAFLVQDFLGLLDFGDFFADTGSDEPVLEPAVRSFDFASGLGGKGMDHLDIAVGEDLFPLGGGFIGEEVMFSPEGVSSLDKAKDGVGVDVVIIREAVSQNHGLQGQDMGPAGFLPDQDGIEQKAAVIVQGSDQVPFLLGGRCPEMMGGVVLDQFPGKAG